MIQFLKKRWVYHTIIWLAPCLAMTLANMQDQDSDFILNLRNSVLFLIPNLVVVYLTFWAKSKLLNEGAYWFYALASIGIVFIGVAIYEGLYLLNKDVAILGNPIGQSIANFVAVQFMAIGLQYFKRGIINQYQLQELKAKTAATELAALRAQINPHFLFNTLNNIHGMNQLDSEKGSEMILKLSDVMRYHLESSKKENVILSDEIQLLQSYIKLEALRLRDTCDLKTNFEEVDLGLKIPPLLLITFVENAFKHGTHPTKKCFIDIKLTSHSGKLSFIVKNSIVVNRKVVKTNIGLQNTRRRLELLFPGKHELRIKQSEDEYTVNLELEI